MWLEIFEKLFLQSNFSNGNGNYPVGGELVPVFGEIMALIIVVVLVTFSVLLYKKGNVLLKLFTRLGY